MNSLLSGRFLSDNSNLQDSFSAFLGGLGGVPPSPYYNSGIHRTAVRTAVK